MLSLEGVVNCYFLQ